jgi:hypothetical protein
VIPKQDPFGMSQNLMESTETQEMTEVYKSHMFTYAYGPLEDTKVPSVRTGTVAAPRQRGTVEARLRPGAVETVKKSLETLFTSFFRQRKVKSGQRKQEEE